MAIENNIKRIRKYCKDIRECSTNDIQILQKYEGI